MASIVITGTGMYAPLRILTNEGLSMMVDTTGEWIVKRTGMHERHIASPEEASTDMMVPAAFEAMKMANKKVDDFNLIVVSSSWMDQFVPDTSDIFAKKFGAPDTTLAKAVTAQCCGFCWAIAEAYDKMRLYPEKYKTVLVVSGDATSRFVDYTDRESCILFGDGGGAVVLEQIKEEGYGILSYIEACDRSNMDCLSVVAGGSAKPASHETISAKEHFMHFGDKGGGPMLEAIVPKVPELCQENCREAGILPSELKLIIPHQLNQRIIDYAIKRLVRMGLRKGVMYDKNIARYANCSGSSVAMALDCAYREGLLGKGDYFQLQSYAAGMKFAAVTGRWWIPKFTG